MVAGVVDVHIVVAVDVDITVRVVAFMLLWPHTDVVVDVDEVASGADLAVVIDRVDVEAATVVVGLVLVACA